MICCSLISCTYFNYFHIDRSKPDVQGSSAAIPAEVLCWPAAHKINFILRLMYD